MATGVPPAALETKMTRYAWLIFVICSVGITFDYIESTFFALTRCATLVRTARKAKAAPRDFPGMTVWR